jgi:hypothetical protein
VSSAKGSSAGEASRARPRKRRQVFVGYAYRLYPKAEYRKIFKRAGEAYDVRFVFADEQMTNMHVMKKIEGYIRSSDFSIFDISGWNPNVTLELGYAMALGSEWYIAFNPSRTEVEVPSDLKGLDRIQYSSFSELGRGLRVVLEQRYPTRASATRRSLASKLDQLLGESNGRGGAWFVYPDDNRNEIGVRRLPAHFEVRSPVKVVHNDAGTFSTGMTIRRPIGSNVTLERPWHDTDIPRWQRDALTKWRTARSADKRGVTKAKVNAIFGNSAWRPVKGFTYAAEGVPSGIVQMSYPITSVDVSNLKYGIGDDAVAARGQRVRIWLAGDIR